MSFRPHLLNDLRSLENNRGMSKVIPGLFVGNLADSKDLVQLEQHHISHIVSVYDNARRIFKDRQYLLLVASDTPGQNMTQFIPQVNDFVHSARLARSNVLIHCLAGMSRSVFLTASYLVAATTLTAGDSLRVVRSVRSVASPNPGFLRQLAEWEASGSANVERSRLAGKFFNQRYSEDEDWAQDRLDLYCRMIGRGDVCEGSCSVSGCPGCRGPPKDQPTFNALRRPGSQGGSLPGSPVRRRKAAPPPPPLLTSSPIRRRRHDEEPPGAPPWARLLQEEWDLETRRRLEERRRGIYRMATQPSSLDHRELRPLSRSPRRLPRSPGRKSMSVPSSPRLRA